MLVHYYLLSDSIWILLVFQFLSRIQTWLPRCISLSCHSWSVTVCQTFLDSLRELLVRYSVECPQYGLSQLLFNPINLMHVCIVLVKYNCYITNHWHEWTSEWTFYFVNKKAVVLPERLITIFSTSQIAL